MRNCGIASYVHRACSSPIKLLAASSPVLAAHLIVCTTCAALLQARYSGSCVPQGMLQPTACLSAMGNMTGQGFGTMVAPSGPVHTNKFSMLRSQGMPEDMILDLMGSSLSTNNLAAPAATPTSSQANVHSACPTHAAGQQIPASEPSAAGLHLEEKAVRATQSLRLPKHLQKRFAAGQLGTAYQPQAVQATHYLMRHTHPHARCACRHT